jgi:cell wall-associated NlpC family hydrolase
VTAAGIRLAAAAESLLGVPFRPGGRDPATGLDCIGLVWISLKRAGFLCPEPARYAMRQYDLGRLLEIAQQAGLSAVTAAIVQPAQAQYHLLIAGSCTGFVHAHAGLRKVVRAPTPLTWPKIRQWRLA